MDSHEVTGTINELKGKAEKGYGKLRDDIDTLTDRSDEFETFSANARRNAEASWEKATDTVRENPAAAIGVAVLVGAGIGALLMAWAKD